MPENKIARYYRVFKCVYMERQSHGNNKMKENLIMLLFSKIDLSMSKLNLVQLGGAELLGYNARRIN